MRKELSNNDKVIFVLGTKGVTEKTKITAKKAAETLSDFLNISESNARKMLSRAESKKLLERSDGLPVNYTLSKDGFKRYLTLRENETKLRYANNTLEELIKRKYFDELLDCVNYHKPLLEISFQDIETIMGLDFADDLRENPGVLDKMNNILKEMSLPSEESFRPKISLVDFSSTDILTVEEVRKSEFVGKLVCVEGRVLTQFEVIPRFLRTAHICSICGEVNYIDQTQYSDKIYEPYECENSVCRGKRNFKIDIEKSTKIDSQTTIIESAKGQVQLTVILDEPLCTSEYWRRDAKFVQVVGVLDMRMSQNRGATSWNFVLIANSIKLADDSKTEPPTPEEIREFEEWRQNPETLREKLIGSVAPHIEGNELIKDALSLALFSDWTWNQIPDDTTERSSLHILLIGDPSIAKTQMMNDLARLSPKAIVAQGDNATGKGMTNSAVQEHGVWAIKAGAFAKADQGILVIDELDKLGEDDLKSFHSILVSQTQKAYKAGLSVEFNTRCAVIGGANPKNGGYLDRYVPPMEQLGKIAGALFTRFDLVFALWDNPDIEKDKRICNKILENTNSNTTRNRDEMRQISEEMYRKYVLYAHSLPAPTIPEKLKQDLGNKFLELRGLPRISNDNNAPVLPWRGLQTLLKLAKVYARRELQTEVNEEHVKNAVNLYVNCLTTLGNGKLDYQILETGSTKDQRDKVNSIRLALNHNQELKFDDIVELTGIPKNELLHYLQHLKTNGSIMEVNNNYKWIG